MNTPHTLTEAVALARALMVDDPAAHKRGYTAENAALAVADVFGFARDDVMRGLCSCPSGDYDEGCALEGHREEAMARRFHERYGAEPGKVWTEATS